MKTELGIDPDPVWNSIKDVVVKTAIRFVFDLNLTLITFSDIHLSNQIIRHIIYISFAS